MANNRFIAEVASQLAPRSLLRDPRLTDGAALALCSIAGAAAWPMVHDLTWPVENDLYRDLAAAQSISDGFAGADPAFLGERWWYNPLVPAVVALIAKVLGLPLHHAYATLGVYLNVLSPVAFYVMVAVLLSRGAALASLVGFLFLGQLDLPSWMGATYSPWLWSCNLAQALFYCSVTLLVMTFRSQRYSLAIAAGVATGLTFLAHTAPALILAGIIVSLAVANVRGRDAGRGSIRLTLSLTSVVCAIALLTASPFWLSIASYGAQIKNPAPLQWIAAELTLDRWSELLHANLGVRGLAAAAGFVALARFYRPNRAGSRLDLFTWLAVALLGLGYGYLIQVVTLPPLLPSWHFYFYLQGLQSVFFGWGVVAITQALSLLLTRAPRIGAAHPPIVRRGPMALVTVGLVVVVATRYDDYVARVDIVASRSESLRIAEEGAVPVYHWLLEGTRPTDVVLADQRVGFYAVQTAGRKTISLRALFSNPYVDVKMRARDADRMFMSLRRGQVEKFLETARQYQVKFVVVDSKRDVAAEFAGVLELVATLPPHRIYAMRDVQ